MKTTKLAFIVGGAAILAKLFIFLPSAQAQTVPELTFGSSSFPEGGLVTVITINTAFPKVQEGFNIQWSDADLSSVPMGPYKDQVWITDDKNNNAVVWSQEINLPGLGAQQNDARVVTVPPMAIAPGTYTVHVRINSENLPELDFNNNEASNDHIDIR